MHYVLSKVSLMLFILRMVNLMVLMYYGVYNT